MTELTDAERITLLRLHKTKDFHNRNVYLLRHYNNGHTVPALARAIQMSDTCVYSALEKARR